MVPFTRSDKPVARNTIRVWSSHSIRPCRSAERGPTSPRSSIVNRLVPLTNLFPAIEGCLPAIKLACERFDISTLNRQAAFIAQCGHESGGYARFTENLNYSAQGLRATFPTHFNAGQAASYARQPQRIANRVYANRMGNGDEASGDGWKYRGRGAIAVTGKSNYAAFAKFVEMSLDDVIAYLATEEGAFISAGWFWKIHLLNGYADTGNMLAVTKIINGGDERTSRALRSLRESPRDPCEGRFALTA
jgi:putative chitinase